MKKVFIDGSSGTTGLRIADRLAQRQDIELVTIPDELRKDPAAKVDAYNRADAVFMCLPDDAAREAAAMQIRPDTVLIDTSTAHRVAEGWTYGFAEIGGRREQIAAAKRIANPGCHASGFIALVAPLIELGLLDAGIRLSAHSLTGYSGGGKKMIAQYEEDGRDVLLDAPRMYGLTQAHKHLPEMKAVCGLEAAPIFVPIVGDYYAGMQVTIPLFPGDIKGTAADIREAYRSYYKDGLVSFAEDDDEGGYMSAGRFAGRDDLTVSVYGNDERILLVSRFDNLGKGASGAAIQNMNIVFGLEEKTGLVTGR